MPIVLPITPDFSKHDEMKRFLKDPTLAGHVLSRNAKRIGRMAIVDHFIPDICHTEKLHMFVAPPLPIKSTLYEWSLSTKSKFHKQTKINTRIINHLKRCMINGGFVVVDISLRLSKINEYIQPGVNIYPLKGDHRSRHAVSVVLDMRGTETHGYYIDSSDVKNSLLKRHYEKMIGIELSRVLKTPIKMISHDEEACPVFHVQGSYPYCATWSLFLFISHILNKSRKKVYEYLKNIGNDCRWMILGLFIFEIWELAGKPQASSSNEVDEAKKYYSSTIYKVWGFEK